MIASAVSAVGMAMAVPVLVQSAWGATLAVIALPRPRQAIIRTGAPLRWAVLVPAHNEEAFIAKCVTSIRAGGTAANVEVLVIADNCTDSTADAAREAGATVLERHDLTRIGKSFALDYALAHLAANDAIPDVVAIIDADSNVKPGFFASLEQRLARGATVVQALYLPGADDRETLPALRRLAFALAHYARPLGAERLGLGATLKGNGMAFRWNVVAGGFGASGITEDAALTLALARRDIAVAFEPRAVVRAYMAPTYRDAQTQDQRWEGGRFSLLPLAIRTAARQARRGRIATAAAAMEVASLPLTVLVGLSAGSLALAAVGFGSLTIAAASAGMLAGSTLLGLVAARASLRDLRALAFAPRFLAHKAGVYASILRHRPASWERTERPSN